MKRSEGDGPRTIVLANAEQGNFAKATPTTQRHSTPKVLEYEGRFYLFGMRRVSKGWVMASHHEVTEQYVEIEVEYLTKDQVVEL